MAKVIDTVNLAIEIETKKDKAVDSIFGKKTFANVRKDVDVEKLSAVANAIKGVISVPTRESFIIESSAIY